MHHPTDRITHTTAFVTPVVEHWMEREIAQWVHPMKDRSDDPSHHERTLLPQSYISLLNKTLPTLHCSSLTENRPLKGMNACLMLTATLVAVEFSVTRETCRPAANSCLSRELFLKLLRFVATPLPVGLSPITSESVKKI